MSDDAPDDQAIVTVPVTAPHPLPPGFTIPGAVAIAKDVAIGMYDMPAILKKHEITPEQYAFLETLPYFQDVLKQQANEWFGPKNSQQRLAIQASTGLEQVLPDAIARVSIKNEPLQGIAQLVKVLADIAGASGNTRQPSAPAERFKITINLGADTEVYNKSKPVFNLDIEETGDPSPVQPQSQGLGPILTLRTDPEKA